MSISPSIERQAVEAELLRITVEEDKLRLALLNLEEHRRKLQYQLNRFRREAGEIR